MTANDRRYGDTGGVALQRVESDSAKCLSRCAPRHPFLLISHFCLRAQLPDAFLPCGTVPVVFSTHHTPYQIPGPQTQRSIYPNSMQRELSWLIKYISGSAASGTSTSSTLGKRRDACTCSGGAEAQAHLLGALPEGPPKSHAVAASALSIPKHGRRLVQPDIALRQRRRLPPSTGVLSAWMESSNRRICQTKLVRGWKGVLRAWMEGKMVNLV